MVSELGLDSVTSQQHTGLGWTVDLHVEYLIFDLQEEQVLCDLLNKFLGDIFRVKLDKKIKVKRSDLVDVWLLQNLLIQLQPSRIIFCVLRKIIIQFILYSFLI